MACVAEQAWIPHKWCLVGEDKPRMRSDEATKLGQKMHMRLGFPLRLVVNMSNNCVSFQKRKKEKRKKEKKKKKLKSTINNLHHSQKFSQRSTNLNDTST